MYISCSASCNVMISIAYKKLRTTNHTASTIQIIMAIVVNIDMTIDGHINTDDVVVPAYVIPTQVISCPRY